MSSARVFGKSKCLFPNFNPKTLAHYLLLNILIIGMPVDIDNLGLFQSYTDIHSWTSTSIIDNKALIVTKKITSVVTIEELRKLSAHLGVTLKLDETRNGRVWASKNNGHLVKSKFQNNTTGGGS